MLSRDVQSAADWPVICGAYQSGRTATHSRAVDITQELSAPLASVVRRVGTRWRARSRCRAMRAQHRPRPGCRPAPARETRSRTTPGPLTLRLPRPTAGLRQESAGELGARPRTRLRQQRDGVANAVRQAAASTAKPNCAKRLLSTVYDSVVHERRVNLRNTNVRHETGDSVSMTSWTVALTDSTL